MLLDNQALYSDKQAITATAVSTNFINHGAPGTPPHAPSPVKADLGGGNKTEVLVQVTEDFAGGTSLQVDLQMSTDAAFTAPVVVASSGVVPAANLTAGVTLSPSIISPGAAYQYSRLNYTVVGPFTAGAITAGVTAGIQTNG